MDVGLFFLALFLLSSLHFSPRTTAFSPNISYFLNCGSTTTTTIQGDNPTRYFRPDSTYLTSTSTSTSTSKPLSTTSATSSNLYTTARAFTSSTSYQFQVTSQATYFIRLHFSPFSSQSYNLTASNFNVSALDRLLLVDFSVTTTTPIIKEFLLWVDANPLQLTFTPDPLAFVNAIEVFTAPSNLIDGASPSYVTGSGLANSPGQLSQQGLETLYRVNVGGALVTPANDTLWRNWIPDDGNFFSNSFAFKNSTNEVKYQANDVRRTPEIAPESVYDTARTMAVTPVLVASNPYFNFNLTWTFRVQPGGTYFIRMHFCDFLFPVTQLYFDVYVGPYLAYADLQPGSFTAMTPAAAFYVDFVANSDASGLMNVSIGRSKRSTPTTANALLNGLEIMKLGLGQESASNGKKKGVSIGILIGSIVGGIVFVASLIIVVVLVCRRRRQSKPVAKAKASPQGSWSPYTPDAANSAYNSRSTDKNTASPSPRVNLHLLIPFDEVLFATNNFEEKRVIGSGGFGKVYKGALRDGTKVAIKRGMPGSRQGYPEFQTEIEVLSKIRHRHLVSLIGYCEDRSEMILVYEYMEKGPLKNYLYGSSDLPCLSWKQRLEICIGAARGLHYLHTGYSHNIIHRDIKSTNILLDEDYVAKVADFGLSRTGPSHGETHVSTAVKGTFGYLDPEYFKVLKLTDKSDVYSFGVMLFEVLCARPVIDPKLKGDELNLTEWALHCCRKGKLEKIVDPKLVGKIDTNSLRKFGETAKKCLADYGVDRPSIGEVLWNLEYALQLQETQVRREPFEDSGTVESQFPVNAVRCLPSSLIVDDDDDDDVEAAPAAAGVARTDELQSGATASTVFSQLITEDGR